MRRLLNQLLRRIFIREWLQLSMNKVIRKYGNYQGDIYCERLISEWLQHGKIILAVDFDSTISYWKTLENQSDIERTIHIVQEAQVVGVYLVIWTACNPDRYKEISAYCKKIGLKIDAINDNPIRLPYGTHKKIYYNHLLDDRTSLPEALDRLEYCLYRVRGANHVTEQNVEF